MALYKVLLVDDEEEVRKNIAQKTPWEELGFCLVGEAENGEDALEQFFIHEPDLVITDIKMPYMDGLTLAKEIKNHSSSTEIVLFSGFNEFEYAQQAIKINITEYILKPVNLSELTKFLVRIKTKIDIRLQEKWDIQKLRTNWQNMQPVLTNHFIFDVLHNAMKESDVIDGFVRFNLPQKDSRYWAVAVTHINEPIIDRGMEDLPLQFLRLEKDLIPLSVKDILTEKIENCFPFVEFTEKNSPGILCGFEQKEDAAKFISLMNQCCIDCRKILKIDVTIGIGRLYDNAGWISESYIEAQDALGYRATLGKGSAIYIADVEEESPSLLLFASEEEAEFINTINFGSRDDVEKMVASLVNKMKAAKVHTNQHQFYLLSIINVIMQMLRKHNLDIYTIWGKEVEFLEIISLIINAENVDAFLLSTCYSLNESIQAERNNAAKDLVRKAKLFISDNFSDPELSVEMICNHLHISQAYFSTLFKNEVGESYVGYLTNLRLEKAKELLEYTDNKTYIIALNIGYSSANYFSYAFKKAFGMAPSKYRDQLTRRGQLND